MALTSLPVLDLSALDQGAAAAEDFRSRLLAATHDVGFFYLTGHGLGDDEVAAAFATAERSSPSPSRTSSRSRW